MNKETVKKVNERDVLNDFHNRWLEKKIELEIGLAYNLGSSILIDDLSKNLGKQMEQRHKLEEAIKNTEKYLRIIDEKDKELNLLK